jgi:hypothetical protein
MTDSRGGNVARVARVGLVVAVFVTALGFQSAHASVPFEAHVNFQPCGIPVPAGYTIDCGYRTNFIGRGYAWNKSSMTGLMRQRNLVSDERLDTLAVVPRQARWKIQVPANHTYEVTVSVGDAVLHGCTIVDIPTVNGPVAIVPGFSSRHHTQPFYQGTAYIYVTGKVMYFDVQACTTTMSGRLDYVDIVQVD